MFPELKKVGKHGSKEYDQTCEPSVDSGDHQIYISGFRMFNICIPVGYSGGIRKSDLMIVWISGS